MYLMFELNPDASGEDQTDALDRSPSVSWRVATAVLAMLALAVVLAVPVVAAPIV